MGDEVKSKKETGSCGWYESKRKYDIFSISALCVSEGVVKIHYIIVYGVLLLFLSPAQQLESLETLGKNGFHCELSECASEKENMKQYENLFI